jgi:hypothetical protein
MADSVTAIPIIFHILHCIILINRKTSLSSSESMERNYICIFSLLFCYSTATRERGKEKKIKEKDVYTGNVG